MTTPQLPERPDLGQLKRQAKELLRAGRAVDRDALARFRSLPALARLGDDARLARTVALHDAQSVIARELGFRSWRELAEHVEDVSLGLDDAVARFVDAATEARPDAAARLLRRHPAIAGASFHTALLLGDVARVEAELARRPALAVEPGGPRGWVPLLYACHTALGFGPADRADGLVAIARRLLALGADPNARCPWLHHGVHRSVLWAATRVARLLPLAALLLDAGADPDDGVTLPMAASAGDIATLDLLAAHGADVNQPWATDGTPGLYAILHWTDTPGGVLWLLDHGADPDPVVMPSGETPLHVAARRSTAEIVAALVGAGADPTRRRADGRTPYAVARLSGNEGAAMWLEEHRAAGELSVVDRFVTACSHGDRATAEAMLAARPTMRAELDPEHYASFYRAAERGDARALETMLACGFDPNRGDDEIGKTALHAAAMEGCADAVRVLLAHGASVTIRDREFNGQPLVWAAEGLRSHGDDGREYDAVGRLLLEAGSPVEWQGGEEPSDGIGEIVAGWQRALAGAS